jgi:mannose-6-phosphate isomerase
MWGKGSQQMQKLEGRVQHYAWGSADALPDFLGRPADGTPWAELWFGAHPLAPSTLVPRAGADGTARAEGLDLAIARDATAVLGEGVSNGFRGRLPYLLKVIAPERPLSLQVHPDRDQAAESFAAETAAGLPLDSPLRTYRDDNHKPEMLVALSTFTALCGFRTPRRAATILEGLGTDLTDRLHSLLVATPTAHGMRAAFRSLVATSMRPSADAVQAVVESCRARLDAGRSPSPRIDRMVTVLAAHHPGDPGVVAALLLNPVTLRPGEALFVPAGTLHAYIRGLGVEIMAASDNVLRAGLTAKKVDADEMLQCVSVNAAPPLRVAPERQSEVTVAYYAPVDDFELTFTTLPTASTDASTTAGEDAYDEPAAPAGSGGPAESPRHRIAGGGPRILLALEGEVQLHVAGRRLDLGAGEAAFVPAVDGPLEAAGRGRLVQACVP